MNEVDIVRCKDCRFKEYSSKNLWCNIFDQILPEEGFCCYGEKYPDEPIVFNEVIKQLHKLKECNPKQIIVVETPRGCVSFNIGDAIIYEGMDGELVIDSE